MVNDQLVVVLNVGSSSQKMSAFLGEQVELRAASERTNQIAGDLQFWIEDNNGREILRNTTQNVDHSSLLEVMLAIVAKRLPAKRVAAVGHRVVHRGDQLTAAVRNTRLNSARSQVSILRIPADEEAMIVKHTKGLINDWRIHLN